MQIKILNNKFEKNDIILSKIRYFDKKNKLVFENDFYIYCKIRDHDFIPKINKNKISQITRCEVELIKTIGSPAQVF